MITLGSDYSLDNNIFTQGVFAETSEREINKSRTYAKK